jgi:hypothetical protein
LAAAFERCLEPALARSRLLFGLTAIILPLTAVVMIVYASDLEAPFRRAVSMPTFQIAIAFLVAYGAMWAASLWPTVVGVVGCLSLLLYAEGTAANPIYFSPTQCDIFAKANRYIIENSRALERQLSVGPQKIFVWAPAAEIAPVSQQCRPLYSGRTVNVALSFSMLGHNFLESPWMTVKTPDELPLGRLWEVGNVPGAVVVSFSFDPSQTSALQRRLSEAGIASTEVEAMLPEIDDDLPAIHLLKLSPMPGATQPPG